MVTTTSLLLFLAASVPLVLIPGPSVAFILATTLRGGRRAGIGATAGVETGYLVHVAGAVLGVSAVLAASASAFTFVKLAGTAWLLWLAWHALRSRQGGTIGELASAGPTLPVASAFRRGLLVGALNPKTAVFFLAFLPQFVDPAAGPVWGQLMLFGVLFIVIASPFDASWALLGGSLGTLLPRLKVRAVDRASGGLYVVLAVATLSARRGLNTS